MKKLKTLCAIVGAAAMLYTAPAFAAEQKYKVPDFNREGAEEKIMYSVITPMGQLPINDPSEAQGLPLVTTKVYGVDRDNDGKKDLVYIEAKIDDIKYKEKGKDMVQKGYTVKQLVIDDDFNGYVERILTDSVDEAGNPGADGVYDEEAYATRIQDFFKN